jgi:hypothetical protein
MVCSCEPKAEAAPPPSKDYYSDNNATVTLQPNQMQQIVGASGTTMILICGYEFNPVLPARATFAYGADCSTNPVQFGPSPGAPAGRSIGLVSGLFFGWYVPSGNNLCVSSTDIASVTMFCSQQ